MELLRLTPEGKIVMELAEGAKSYNELKSLTKLSDRWLSKKLKELIAAGVVERRDAKYALAKPNIICSDPLAFEYFKAKATLLGKAKLISSELSKNDKVLAIVLFGSAAKGRFSEESDLDLLIITREEVDLNEEVYKLSFKYLVPIEAISISFEELLSHAQSKTAFLLGIMEGYKLLYDRIGIGAILSFLKEVVDEGFSYDEEAGAWIQKNTPISKAL